MRNSKGVEVKAGYWAWYRPMNSSRIREGRVWRVSKETAVIAREGETDHLESVSVDRVDQVLPPMRRTRGGLVKANPLTRVTVDGLSQRERVTKQGTRTKRPSARLIKRRIKTASTMRRGIYANPLKRVKLNSPSMATGDPPDTRLRDRRKRTAKAPAGFYANPLKPSAERFHVTVKKPRSNKFESVAKFKLWEFAVAYGRALHNAHPGWAVKIEERAR